MADPLVTQLEAYQAAVDSGDTATSSALAQQLFSQGLTSTHLSNYSSGAVSANSLQFIASANQETAANIGLYDPSTVGEGVQNIVNSNGGDYTTLSWNEDTTYRTPYTNTSAGTTLPFDNPEPAITNPYLDNTVRVTDTGVVTDNYYTQYTDTSNFTVNEQQFAASNPAAYAQYQESLQRDTNLYFNDLQEARVKQGLPMDANAIAADRATAESLARSDTTYFFQDEMGSAFSGTVTPPEGVVYSASNRAAQTTPTTSNTNTGYAADPATAPAGYSQSVYDNQVLENRLALERAQAAGLSGSDLAVFENNLARAEAQANGFNEPAYADLRQLDITGSATDQFYADEYANYDGANPYGIGGGFTETAPEEFTNPYAVGNGFGYTAPAPTPEQLANISSLEEQIDIARSMGYPTDDLERSLAFQREQVGTPSPYQDAALRNLQTGGPGNIEQGYVIEPTPEQAARIAGLEEQIAYAEQYDPDYAAELRADLRAEKDALVKSYPEPVNPYEVGGGLDETALPEEPVNPYAVGGGLDATATPTQESVSAAALERLKSRPTSQQRSGTNKEDLRVRLQLAPGSSHFYKAGGEVLRPLMGTDGIIFPYTPFITTGYEANYNEYQPTHSNYRHYFYKGSAVTQVLLEADFTAQSTEEANYLLAVIHFLRSATKMWYGQDPERGSPPPLLFLTGLGEFQFKEHPLVISRFNYILPEDVDYIKAGQLGGGGGGSAGLGGGGNSGGLGGLLGGLGGLAQEALGRAVAPLTNSGPPWAGEVVRRALNSLPFGAEPSNGTPQGNPSRPSTPTVSKPTLVPTKMRITLELLPVQSRHQVSQEFSLKDYAEGTLLKKGFW